MVDLAKTLSFLKKHITFRDAIIALALIALYLITRLINLDQFPIFTDEGIYIRWAKVAQLDPNWRFISLTDGKQPLHTWGMMPFIKLIPDNLLLAGRLFSALSGFVAMIGMMALAAYMFGRKYAAYVAALLYIATPMFLFYDRLALADSAVNAGAIWVLFGSLMLVKTLRLDAALLLGMIGGVALLAKSSSQMFLGLSLLAPIVTFDRQKIHRWLSSSATYTVLLGLSIVLAFVIYNVQRLSPFLQNVAEKNKTFVLTFSEFVQNPFALFLGNIHLIPWYVSAEVGYVLVAIAIAGFVMLARHNPRLALYLGLWIILPYVAITAFAKVLFPRYVLYLASFLTIAATYFFISVKRQNICRLVALGYVASVGYFSYTIMFAPAAIPLPPVDRGQYIESFNAGWGVKEIVQYARDEVSTTGRPVKFLAEGNFGVIGDMLESSINRNDAQIVVAGYWPLGLEQLLENQKDLDTHTVLIVFSHKQSRSEISSDWPVKYLKTYTKPGLKDPYFLYELTR